jgi:hypothetical protein
MERAKERREERIRLFGSLTYCPYLAKQPYPWAKYDVAIMGTKLTVNAKKGKIW